MSVSGNLVSIWGINGVYKKKKVCVWLCVLESICLWCMFFWVELKSERVKPYFGRIVCFWCRKTLRGCVARCVPKNVKIVV